jgi:tRNA (guanine37-N1)-methyltransferase
MSENTSDKPVNLQNKSHAASDVRGKSHGRIAVRPSLQPRDLMVDTPDLVGTWKAKIITLLPTAFPSMLGESLTGKALSEGLWQIEPIDLRMFGEGKHRNVDDTPSGGGAGMVLRPDIMGKAVDFAMNGVPADRKKWPLVYMSPRGKRFDQATAQRWSEAEGITMICGRFEGLDERVIEHFDIEEVSLGDFVLTGGEIPVQAMIDATVRLLPGVLGNAESIEDESHSNGLLEHPQYTRPTQWRGHKIPDVLMSGHHAKIAKWREDMARALTQDRRPDMWKIFTQITKLKK